MMTLYKNINSLEMKTVGAVVFIFLLLLIAGVEPNPGPADMLVFRYQYLLIKVATTLLRKLFDFKVNYDLMQYLKTNPHLANKLNVLINNDIITENQKKFLPPLDNNPNTANFDITLLYCLLRNICGLKTHRDPVWQKPANGDLSVEAEICRVKECRNYIVHKGTVHISESDFNLKWKTLCQILYRLNYFCGVSNLTEMINEAYTIPLDDEFKQKHDNILKAWHEAESLFEKGIDDIKIRQSEIMIAQSESKDELKDGQSKLMDGQSEIMRAVSDVQEQTKRRLDNFEQANNSKKRIKSYTYDDVKECLQKSYETNFQTLCVTPLFSEDDRMDMLTIYTQPKMEHVPYHKSRQREGNYEISSYEQVFCETNTAFRNIFVTGDAGMGKTSFGQFMALLWSMGDNVGNELVRKDASFIEKKFDFVFHVSLKETIRKDVVSMIIDKYFNTSSKDEFEETTKTIEQILRTQNCLVILDGLDEWRPDMGGNTNHSLPSKVSDDRSTYLTTCRSYRIETVPLKEHDIDHQVKITGFDHEKYIRKVIAYINKSQNTNKNPEDFLRQISRMGDQSKNPLITSQLIVVWFKNDQDGLRNMSKAMIYGNIVEMLFERAKIKNQITFPLLTPTDVQLPKSFSTFTYLQKYVSTLEKVCLLSFLLLFDPKKETLNLVYTKKQLMSEPYNICPEEIEFLCQLGIISKHKVIASFGEQEQMLSFLHQSYLEFLAAIFVSFFDKKDLFSKRVKAISIRDIENYKNFLVLLSGISSQMTSSFFTKIHIEKKDQINILRKEYFASHEYIRPFDFLQSIILTCCKEISVSDNSQSDMKLEDYNFENDDLNEFDLTTLKTLLDKNKANVKCVSTQHYLNEFASIEGLQYLQYSGLPHDELPCTHVYDDRFTILISHNKTTLQSIRCHYFTLSSELPLSNCNLTSIHFFEIIINHTILHDLMDYISNNDVLENIYLHKVVCKEHKECKLTLNLSDHSKLQRLTLDAIDLECNGIKNSSLASLFLGNHAYTPFWKSWKSAVMLKDPAHTINNSKLTHLSLDGCTIPQSEVNHVINTIRSLLHIEYLKLKHLTITDDASLQLHPNTESNQSIFVSLSNVRMRQKCFHEFIDSIRNNQSMVRVRMYKCYVPFNNTSDLNTHAYMLRYVRTFRSFEIINVHSQGFGFDTIK